MTVATRDLIALVADNDIRATVLNLLSRPDDLDIRPIDVKRGDVPVHPYHDPGCLNRADEFLRPFSKQYEHALVIFDRKGCGKESEPAESIEREVERNLERSGWSARCAAVVIDPELEVWVWSDSPQVARCLRWRERKTSVREWLRTKGLWPPGEAKPSDPREAFRRVLRETRQSRSSAIFAELAGTVGFRHCGDLAFSRLQDTLRAWFPPQPGCRRSKVNN